MVTNMRPSDLDQKKRTLDALEQRVALAKAELSQQQKNNKKQISDEGKNIKAQNIDSSSNDNVVQRCRRPRLMHPINLLSHHIQRKEIFHFMDMLHHEELLEIQTLQ